MGLVRTLHRSDGNEVEIFIVNWQGTPRAYVNACAHMQLALDWRAGLFFDNTNQYLICSTHGALFRPEDGYCISGPCAGLALQSIDIVLLDNSVALAKDGLPHDVVHCSNPE